MNKQLANEFKKAINAAEKADDLIVADLIDEVYALTQRDMRKGAPSTYLGMKIKQLAKINVAVPAAAVKFAKRAGL